MALDGTTLERESRTFIVFENTKNLEIPHGNTTCV